MAIYKNISRTPVDVDEGTIAVGAQRNIDPATDHNASWIAAGALQLIDGSVPPDPPPVVRGIRYFDDADGADGIIENVAAGQVMVSQGTVPEPAWESIDTFVDAAVAGRLLPVGADLSGASAGQTIDAHTGLPINKADLVAGKVPAGQIPAIAISNVFPVASQAAQLALTAEVGDVAVRSDLNKSYIHNGGTAGTMADWTELLTPTDVVLSVAGRVGAVVLAIGDITGLTAALAAKKDAASAASRLNEVYAADPAYGLVAALASNNPTTIHTALQAAFTAATAIAAVSLGATVILPTAYMTVDDELVYGDGVSVVGQGAESTALVASHDFGVGKFLVRPATSRTNKHLRLQGFSVRGRLSGYQKGEVPGTTNGVWAMDGVGVPSSTTIDNVYALGGCRAGIHLLNDHHVLRDVTSANNYYNVYFGYDYGAEGDQAMYGCILVGAMRASIGVAGSNIMNSVTLSDVHLGASPYGIWKESTGDWANFPTFPGETTPGVGGGGANALLMYSCKFSDVAFEGCCNTLISGADMVRTLNLRGAFSAGNSYVLNDVVTYNSAQYRALRTIGVGAGPNPGSEGTQPTYWGLCESQLQGNSFQSVDGSGNFVLGAGGITAESNPCAIAATDFEGNSFRDGVQIVYAPSGKPFVQVVGKAHAPIGNLIEVTDLSSLVSQVPGNLMDDMATYNGRWFVRDHLGAEGRVVIMGSGSVVRGDVVSADTNDTLRAFNNLAHAEVGVALEGATAPASFWMQTRGSCSTINVVAGTVGPFLVGTTTAGQAGDSPGHYGIARKITGINSGSVAGEII